MASCEKIDLGVWPHSPNLSVSVSLSLSSLSAIISFLALFSSRYNPRSDLTAIRGQLHHRWLVCRVGELSPSADSSPFIFQAWRPWSLFTSKLLHYKPLMISFHESYGGTLQALDFLDIEFAARFFCWVVDMIALFLVICWVVNHLKLGVIGVAPES